MSIVDGINKQEKIDSFLMMGQSNMAGRGIIGEVEKIANEMCFMLRNGRWQPMAEPINPDRDIFKNVPFGVNLCASFADLYAKHFNREVGLIPCADGGTKIIQWQPGELLYDHAIFQANLAKRTSEIKAILWHQGESDCKLISDLDAYEERVINTLSSARRDLGQENLPVIMGEISYDIAPQWETEKRHIEFNKRLPKIAERLGDAIVVSSEGLKLSEDGIHFTAKSLRIFGERYFEAYLKLTEVK